jgi:HK97 gp10 family phage protein
MAKIRGGQQLSANMASASKKVQDAVFRGLFAAANLIETEMELSITRGSVSGKGHVPSRPGEPPNADTRQLDTSIVTVPDRKAMTVRIVVGAPYGPYLEFGTSKMAARPFARPALRNNRREALALIQRAVRNAR